MTRQPSSTAILRGNDLVPSLTNKLFYGEWTEKIDLFTNEEIFTYFVNRYSFPEQSPQNGILLNWLRIGFFIEAGAWDGVYLSNSLFFEEVLILTMTF